MRIALVVHDFDPSFGHGRYVTELAQRYSAEHEVHVFANTFMAATAGLHLHRVPALRTTALATILSFYPAATLQVRGSFDIVHAQGFSCASANVVTAHISHRRWTDVRRASCRGRLPWRESLFGALVSPLERRAIKARGVTVIAVSDALGRDLRNDGVATSIHVIPHGVDTRQFNPGVVQQYRVETRRELGCASDDEALFLFVGDLRKGFVLALKALASSAGRLVAVSRSDPSPMVSIAAHLGVAGRVRVVPASSQIERYYAAADCFVFPTTYDAFGMVITEAMACGLPVITTAAAGAAELIADGRTGFVLRDSGNVEVLASRMREMAENGVLRATIGRSAAQAIQAHSWDNVAHRTMSVYQQVARSRNPASA